MYYDICKQNPTPVGTSSPPAVTLFVQVTKFNSTQFALRNDRL